MSFTLSPTMKKLALCQIPQDYADLSMEVLGNPMLILDMNLRVIAATDVDTGDESYERLKKEKSLDPDTTRDKGWLEKIRRDLSFDAPQVNETNGVTIIFKNLRDNGVMVGQMLVSAYFRPFTGEDYNNVELMSYPLAMAVFRQIVGRRPISSEADHFLEYLLDGNQLNKDDLERKLMVMDWHPGPELYVLCAAIGGETGELAGSFLRDMISQRDRLIRYHGSFVALLSGGETGVDSLERELKKMGLVCGLSTPFSDLTALKGQYAQALAALEIGVRVDGEKSLYRYEELMDYALIHKYEPKSQLLGFVTPSVLALVADDSGRELLKTLRAYLYNNRSVQKTAASLHVHRNTVAYRVTKAMERLGMNMDDGRDFRGLYSSLQILEYVDREKYFG